MTDKQILETKLTSAAKEALDEVIESYKQEVLIEASRHAQSVTGEIREISVTDLVESLKRKTKHSANQRYIASHVAAQIYIALGASLGVIAGFIEINRLQFSNPLDVLSLLFIATGVIFPFFYERFLPNFFLERKSDKKSMEGQAILVSIWRDLELATRLTLASKVGESQTKNLSTLEMLSSLIKLGIISTRDRQAYRNMLALRNKIVHQGYEPSLEEIRSAQKRGALLLAKLYHVRS